MKPVRVKPDIAPDNKPSGQENCTGNVPNPSSHNGKWPIFRQFAKLIRPLVDQLGRGAADGGLVERSGEGEVPIREARGTIRLTRPGSGSEHNIVGLGGDLTYLTAFEAYSPGHRRSGSSSSESSMKTDSGSGSGADSGAEEEYSSVVERIQSFGINRCSPDASTTANSCVEREHARRKTFTTHAKF